jgi:hypothetical protein
MSIKNVLVIVSAAEEDNACLRLAFAVAEQHQAKVAALYVKPVVAVYSDGMGFDMTPIWIQHPKRPRMRPRHRRPRPNTRSNGAARKATSNWLPPATPITPIWSWLPPIPHAI